MSIIYVCMYMYVSIISIYISRMYVCVCRYYVFSLPPFLLSFILLDEPGTVSDPENIAENKIKSLLSCIWYSSWRRQAINS